MASVVCLFNHKGGVSKTTTAFNLGWMIATKNKRVLLVDCDPQCNLTGMVLGFDSMDDIGAIGGKARPGNIRDGLAPAFESRPTPIQAVECLQIAGNENLVLLPGHIGLSEYEVTLGIAQELTGSLVTLRNLPGSLRFLIDATAREYRVDYVVVDMSPSLGPINQNLLMTADYFIVPMQPDYFSMMAIDSLTSVIPKWRQWAVAAQQSPILAEASYPLSRVVPKFLGTIIQKYKPRGGGVPAKAFQQWIDQLEAGLKERLVPALQKVDMLLALPVYESAGCRPDVPLLQMPDFNSLIAQSQKHRVPVFALSDEQLERGGIVLDNTRESMWKFDKLFSDAADRVIALIGNANSN
jgi:cellulose biosynthesis protein BcsQ